MGEKAKRLLVAALLLSCAGATCAGSRNRDPKKAQTRIDLAVEALRRGQPADLDQAEEEARRALAYDDRSPEAYRILGLAEFLRAMHNFRLRELEDCLTGIDADALRQEFGKLLDSADKHLARALELDSKSSEALANRGLVAIHREAHDEAISYLERALDRPDGLGNVAIVRSDLGWSHFLSGDPVSAANHLRQALQFEQAMSQTRCVATYRLGRVYFGRKEWHKALESFQAVTAAPACTLQEAHLYLVMTYRELGMPISEKVVQQCVNLAPKGCMAARCRTQLTPSDPDQP
jgi:Tfp pilus assembly protein PilF